MNHKQPTSTAVNTAEELILQEVFGNFVRELPKNDFSINQYIKCMKLYANQKLQKASEIATTIHYNQSNGNINSAVNKESILSLKDKI